MAAWSEEFIGAAGEPPDPGTWIAEVGGGGWGDAQLQTYTQPPANAQLTGDGRLRITARADEDDPGRITSARLTTRGRLTFRHGSVAARIKVPAGPGVWPALWMLGADIDAVGWPACGEIDVMEVVGGDPTAVHGTVHLPGHAGVGQGIGCRHDARAVLAEDFHVYSVDWDADRVAWRLDGREYFRVTRADLGGSWPFDRPFFLILNLAVGGRWPGNALAPESLPAEMLVDWIRFTGTGTEVTARPSRGSRPRG
ncbi:glycoside hydrolase family 16 protein [Microbacterium ureisolvens]|uniref:glycoside hydrolase family 16 protein n=1 Tax=Microbacterium ureisolvens TaxID=2781186 RepID=UPI00363E20DD